MQTTKQRIKQLSLLIILSFFFGISLTSCEKDLYEEGIQNSSRNIKVTNVSLSSLDKATSSKIKEKISLLKNLKTESNDQGKFQFNDALGVYVDTENGKLANNNGKLYYTFPMYRKSEEKLENIIFVPLISGEMETYFAKYNVKAEEFNDLTTAEIPNLNPVFQKIYFDGGTQYICVDLQIYQAASNAGISSSSLQPLYNYEWVTIASACSEVIGGDVDWGGDNGGSGTGDTSGTSGGASTGGGLSTAIVGLSPEDIKIKEFVMQLSVEQHAWYISHPELHASITSFVADNSFDPNNPGMNHSLFAMQMINQMMQNPTVFTSITPFLIEKNINDTLLDPCSKGVFQQIKNTTVCDFANLFAKLGADNSVYNTTLRTEHNNVIVGGQLQQVTAPANTIRTTPGTKYNYTVYINPDYPGKTKLFIAALLLHEMAHAYFFSAADDFNTGVTNSFNELPILFNAAVVHHFPINSDLHHEEIANSYTSAIAAALQEYQPGLPQQVYEDLAWGGLYGTPIFETLFPVGNPNRERIINRYACEQTGNPSGQGTANQQNPMGQPCN